VGGALVSSVGWRAIFLINLPVGLAAIALTLRFVPESRAPKSRRFDPVGQGLVIVLLSTLTFGIIEAPSHGWTSPGILAAFAAAAAALVGLLVYEPRRHEPLVDLRFFRSIPFASAIVISVVAFAAFGGFLFLNTLYLQQARGLSPLHAGLYLLPMAATTLVVGPLTGRLLGRVGARPSLVLGGAGICVSGLLLTGLTPTTPPEWLFASYVVFGIGFASVNPPITNTAVSGMPPSQAGVAAAIASTSRQVGASLGIAVIGALAVPRSGSAGSLAEASHVGWWIIAACGALVVVLGVATTTRRALATARLDTP
jgi:MFS family permease